MENKSLNAGKPIRVLIVDDSAVMRALLRMTLETCPEVELAGMAFDGAAGVEAIERLRPDLVLLDIEMPRMNGLEVLNEIRTRGLAVKVMMCSTLTRRGASITLEALARGAIDYVTKPTAQHGVRDGVEALSRDLLPKILALFPDAPLRILRGSWSVTPREIRQIPADGRQAQPGLLVVGVSTGGPAALEKFLPVLPSDFPLPVLIVQHMPPLFTTLLAERLHALCSMPVHEAMALESLQPGTIVLARGDSHMQIVAGAGRPMLRLTQTIAGEFCRPSVDVLFRSAAAVYGAAVVAVVLTGMGSDGLDGCRAIHAAGGRILAQDRATSAVWGMPGVVAEAGLADQVLPLDALAAEVARAAAQNARSKLA